MRLLTILLLAVVGLSGCGSAAPTTGEQARAIERRVWSPYCPGRLLAECTTRQSAELREEIATRLDGGSSPDEVLSWLRTNYGEEVVADPAASPAGLAIWLVPGVVLVAGAVLVLLLVRRWTTATDTPADPRTEEDTVWRSLVREEVERDL